MHIVKCLRVFMAWVSIVGILGSAFLAYGQWGPPAGQPTYPQQPYPPPTGQQTVPPQQPYPGQAPTYPPQPPQYAPPPQPSYGAPGGAQSFSDALGRFRMSLPQGTVPMGATYNFSLPAAMCQVSVMSVAQNQMFQMQQQNFPNMLKQMGAKIDAEQPMDVNGRPARLIAATMRDQMSGTSMHSINVFISQADIWVQVMGPEQNAQQLGQVLQSVLSGLQF
jgi:hypothetical protein